MNISYLNNMKVNSAKAVKYTTILVLLIAIYLAPTADYLISGLKYLPGYSHHPDTTRNPVQIIESRGFKAENHYITTKDGYILTLNRIINPYVKNRQNLRPILFQHGFQSSAKGWLIHSLGKLSTDGTYSEPGLKGQVSNGLAFLLASEGYDVWLANMRGNVYSLNHTKYSSEDTEYWKFSIDEMIEYDLPAMIDHILHTTDKKTLSYIGHSKGTIMMFGLLASQLHYNDIIKPFIALSPVSFLGHSTTPLLFMTYFEPLYRSYPTSLLHMGKVQEFYTQLCENQYMQRFCQRIFYHIMGFGEQHCDLTRMGPYLSTIPSGSSTWAGTHLLQKLITKRPTMFNFGEEGNIARYGQPVPPEYDLSAINSTNIALIYAANDWLNDPKDIAILKQTLKVKLLEDYLVPDHSWNHMELMWAKDVGKYVNSKVLDILKRAR